MRFQVNSGADVNIIDEHTFSHLKRRVRLSKTRARLYAYGSRNPLPVLGKFTATLATSKRYDVGDIYVVQGAHHSGSLLGSGSATALGILHIANNVKCAKTQNMAKRTVASDTKHSPKRKDQSLPNRTVDKLVTEYDDLFHGIGKMKDVQVKLHLDEEVQPVAQKHHRVPFHLREKLDAELKPLERANIIEKVDTATDWVSPIVIAPKTGTDEIRMCVDMVEPN